MQTRTNTRHSKYYTQDFKPFAGIRSWKNSFGKTKTSQSPKTPQNPEPSQIATRQVSYSQKLNSLRLEGVRRIDLGNSSVVNKEPLIKTIVNRPKLKESGFEITESISQSQNSAPKTFTDSEEFKLLRQSQQEESQKIKTSFLKKVLSSPVKLVKGGIKNFKTTYNWLANLIIRVSNRLGKVGSSGFLIFAAIGHFIIELASLVWAIVRMFGYIFSESAKAFLFIFGLRKNQLISKQDRKSSSHPKKVVAN